MQSWFSYCAAAPRWTRLRLGRVLVLAAVFVSGLIGASEAWADAPVTWYGLNYRSTNYLGAGWNKPTKNDACALIPQVHNATSAGYAVLSAVVDAGGVYCRVTIRDSAGVVRDISDGGFIPVTWCANNTAPDTSKPLASQCGAAPPSCSDASVKNKYVGAWVVGLLPIVPRMLQQLHGM